MPVQLSMRLLLDTERNKVVFAEADKGVVDFLFSLLALPVGAIVKLLSAKNHASVLEGIAKVHQSLEQLDETFLQPHQEKNSLLDPIILSTTSPNTLLRPAAASAVDGYYRCSNLTLRGYCDDYLTEIKGARCPGCRSRMRTELKLVGADGSVQPVKVEKVGIVKGLVTYTIADDLTVTPMSTFSNIGMLNKFHVQDLSILNEKKVNLGSEEGLELLRASLQSKTVLTDVFLPGQKTDQAVVSS